MSAPLDSVISIVTPENIAFEYRIAGPIRRFPAFVLDLFVRIVAFWILAFFVGLLGPLFGVFSIVVLILLWFALSWFYGGVCETLFNGRTPGKMIAGLRVMTVDGRPINGLQAVLRNILREVDLMPLLSIEMFGAESPAYVIPTFLVGLVVMTCNSRFQRLGDLVCGTIVVIDDRRWLSGVHRVNDPRVMGLASLLPTDFRVSRSLARALTNYMDRRERLTAARRLEIARSVAEPLLRRFGLPGDTDYDLLLCSLHYRTFIADRTEDEREAARIRKSESPFAVNAAR